MKNAYIGEYKIFDFQNEWQLWWTLDSESGEAANIWYESWQWLYMYNRSLDIWQAWFFKMPSNMPVWTLKSIKIHYYLPNTASWVWIRWWNISSWFHRWRNSYTIWLWNSTPVNIGNYIWEIIAEWNITSTGCSWTISGKAFTFTSSEANNFITAYNNKALKIYGVARYHSNRIYIRKVEIGIE